MNLRANLIVVFIFSICSILSGQNFWSDRNGNKSSTSEEIWIQPEEYRAISLDYSGLAKKLKTNTTKSSKPQYIQIPLPSGDYQTYQITPNQVMAPELAAKFPEIQTFSGTAADDHSNRIYIDITPAGFHAMIISPKGTVFIDPNYKKNNKDYVVYTKQDYKNPDTQNWKCSQHSTIEYKEIDPIKNQTGEWTPIKLNGTKKSMTAVTLKTYRLAVSAQKEYTNFHGGSSAQGLAAVVTSINRVTGVYETELAVKLVLVANNDQIIFTNANDPFSNNGNGSINENGGIINNSIGSANYDIGHVFNTNSGLAALGVVCSNFKAMGTTGLSRPTGDPFWIDYVAHEIGHQFGGSHTFAGNGSFCQGNGSLSSAYEPGSGSTIQAYAGICGSQNIQNNSDAYFHLRSLNQMTSHITNESGASCPVTSATGNNAPTANAGNDKAIPINTPFELTGTGTDPDGDQLTYCWEQWDAATSFAAINATSTTNPIFRSYAPTTSPTRVFPRLSDLLYNVTSTVGEVLPAVARTLNFQLIVRDNKAVGGGVDNDLLTITVVDNGGAFAITSHNSASSESGDITVTWNVAGTTNAPINCSNVNILLSLDGGQLFSTTLASNVTNNGSHSVTLPDVTVSTARIKVKCADNVFFDINNSNFTILPGGSTCESYSSSNTPVAINDNTVSTDTITITDQGSVVDLNIKNLMGTHSYVGDLTFDLKSPQGTTVRVLNRTCNNTRHADFNLSLDDQAANNNIPCPPTSGNSYQPVNALSAFNGENPMDDWVLIITDNINSDAGTLTSWSLEICGIAGCDITGLTAGTQGACNPAIGTYTQNIIVSYTSPPSSGTLNVNGQPFAITTSPQTVELTDLTYDGQAVNVSASFSADAQCSITSNDLFTAPQSCILCNLNQSNITGSISDSTFISKLSLDSDASVTSGSVLFRSPISVLLDTDFQVSSNAAFEVQIGDCTDDD